MMLLFMTGLSGVYTDGAFQGSIGFFKKGFLMVLYSCRDLLRGSKAIGIVSSKACCVSWSAMMHPG